MPQPVERVGRPASPGIFAGPIVEGAVMAATESSAGSSLAAVRSTAEELYAGSIVP